MSGISSGYREPTGNAWVTLATNDTYALGAVVLGHSLKRVQTRHEKCVMITENVSQSMRDLLQAAFESVVVVSLLDSEDTYHLNMLERPELGVTFTKLHCWLRTAYEKCVFLDADTLVLENCDELFEREEFSAAPDVGWPDCFNSGVFVFRPNPDTFGRLVKFALHTKSFDGGDQGLLNLFFKNWALEGPDKRLPFIYNMCSTACYSYIPAFVQFGSAAKIVHFIGPQKPWTFKIDLQTGKVNPAEFAHLAKYLQDWWDLCIEIAMPHLTTEMGASSSTDSATVESGGATTTTLRSDTSVGPITSVTLQSAPEFHLPFVDPWDAFIARNTTDRDNNDPHESIQQEIPSLTVNNHFEIDKQLNTLIDSHIVSKPEQNMTSDTDWDDLKLRNIVLVDRSSPISYPYKNCNLNENSDTFQAANTTSGIRQTNKIGGCVNETPQQNAVDSRSRTNSNTNSDTHSTNTFKTTQLVTISPTIATPSTSPTCTEMPCCEQAVDTKLNAGDDSICLTNDETNAGGLPGMLSAMSIGAAGANEAAGRLEDHWRRTAWESSNADYMHRDSFDKVWEKIQETLEGPEQSPPGAEPAGEAAAGGESVEQAETPTEDPKGAPPAETTSPAVATPPLPSALVDVDSSSASNLGSLAQTVSHAVAPLLTSLEPSLPPAASELDAVTAGQVVTAEPSIALDPLAGGSLSAEVALSSIPADSAVPELLAEALTAQPAIPVPALPVPAEPSAESQTTEQPAAPIPALPAAIPAEPSAESQTTEQPATPIPALPAAIPAEPSAESQTTEQPAAPIPALPAAIPAEPSAESQTTEQPAAPIPALPAAIPAEPSAESQTTEQPATPIPALPAAIPAEPSAESQTTEQPATPIPALPAAIPVEPSAESQTIEQPAAPIPALPETILAEPVGSPSTEQPVIPIPAPSASDPSNIPAEVHTTVQTISAVPNEPCALSGDLAVPVVEGEGPSVTGDPQLVPGPVPSEPLLPQPVPSTPTVIEATPPTSPPIGQASAFPLAPPAPALVGTALVKERAETAPASQNDDVAPVPPKRRGGPSKGGKSAKEKGKK